MFRFTTQDVWIASQVKQFKIVDHPGAAAILVVEDGKVLLVEQYRPAARRKMLELPAGTRELNEDPLVCAKRELKEETGYQARTWESLGHVFPTPGYTTEVLYLFQASDLIPGEQVLPEDEDVTVRWLSVEKVDEMIQEGQINDAKTLIAFLKYLKKCQ